MLLSAVGRAAPPEKRSLAMGIASAAGSFGQFIMLPSTLLLLQSVGWSGALIVSAILIVLIVPLAWMLKAPMYQNPNASSVSQPALGFKQVLVIAKNHKPFWFLALGFFVCGFQVVFIGIHLPSYLIDHGFNATTGTVFSALVGLFNIVGTYTAGWLGGRYSKPHLLMWLYD